MGSQQSTRMDCKTRAKKVSQERAICEIIGSAFIEEIGGQNSSLFELSSLPLLFRELHGVCLKRLFERPFGRSLLSFGNNFYGQLGLGDRHRANEPQTIPSLTGLKIVQVCCGDYHSLVLVESGEVFSWGHNDLGQLGLCHFVDISKPTEITTLKGKQVTEICCGTWHNMALVHNGDAYSWGCNSFGQLGSGKPNGSFSSTPTQIPFFIEKKVSNIFCGPLQSFAFLGEFSVHLKFNAKLSVKNNEVFAWGDNSNGGFGIDTQEKNIPIPKQIKSLIGKNVISICYNAIHSLALTENGQVLFCGNKNFDPNNVLEIQSTFKIVTELVGKKIISIGCGSFHCVAVAENGDLYTWGSNFNAQLGFGDKLIRLIPEKVPSFEGKQINKIMCGLTCNIAKTNSEETFFWGYNFMCNFVFGKDECISTPSIIPQLQMLNTNKIIEISCGKHFVLTLLNEIK